MSRVSIKLRRQVMYAISDAGYEVIKAHCPFSDDGPPDTWAPEEVLRWDQLNDQQDRITKAVAAVFDAAMAKKPLITP